jgi:ligand-binding sensor domain-containing protein
MPRFARSTIRHSLITILAAALAPESGIAAHQMIGGVINHVMEDHAGAMWFSTRWGIARQDRNTIYRYRPYGGREVSRPIRTYEDGQGTVWTRRDGGVFRAQRESLEPLLTCVTPRSILADRDGNLCMGRHQWRWIDSIQRQTLVR